MTDCADRTASKWINTPLAISRKASIKHYMQIQCSIRTVKATARAGKRDNRPYATAIVERGSDARRMSFVALQLRPVRNAQLAMKASAVEPQLWERGVCPATSSVIIVPIDLPISWYWGPFPGGPSRMNRNLTGREQWINLHIPCMGEEGNLGGSRFRK